MARRPKQENAPTGPAKLVVPRAKAQEQLADRIAKAHTLASRPINSMAEFKQAQREYEAWDEYNSALIRRIFDTAEQVEKYDVQLRFSSPYDPTLGQRVAMFREDAEERCGLLESLLARLDIIDEAESVSAGQPTASTKPPISDLVFIVHGHDAALKQEVARFVDKLRLQAVILSEQPNAGGTVIEKFEAHAETAGFAIVLLTPDDFGGVANGQVSPRARQNVILELGYFFGKLGRKKVCALYTGNVELPSDILGVVYTPVAGDWKLQLAREMKVAGLNVDLNLAF